MRSADIKKCNNRISESKYEVVNKSYLQKYEKKLYKKTNKLYFHFYAIKVIKQITVYDSLCNPKRNKRKIKK